MKHVLTLLALLTATASAAETPAIHGMLLFGKQATYASHLPMFHAPHATQAIFKITLSETTGESTLSRYEQAKSKGETFTLLPEKLALSKLLDGTLNFFSGVIYAGHFERGGQPLGKVVVQVEKVIFTKPLVANEPTEQERYIVFGQAGEYFAAHVIRGKPSADVILSVSVPATVTQLVCHSRVCTDIEPKATDDSKLPLEMNAAIPIPGVGDTLGSSAAHLSDVLGVIYSETAELSF